MKQYVAFPLETGFVVAELTKEDTSGAGKAPAAFAGKVTATAATAFSAAMASVKPIAQTVMATMSNISDQVAEVDVEFGLKLNATLGVVITSGGVEANFKVVLKWKRT
jgi:hypothetical protein